MHKLLCIGIAMLTGASASGQPCSYVVDTSPLNGVDAAVTSMVRWDPDGPGPLPERLVMGGNFAAAGSVFAAGLASFDGASWLAMGNAITQPNLRNISALGLYNDQLVMSQVVQSDTPFRSVGRYNWATQSWEALGGGFPIESTSWSYALQQFGSDLIVGGTFDGIAGVPGTRGIAAWNGTNWRSIAGFTSPATTVFDATVYNGRLVIAGQFTMPGVIGGTNIAAWDGTNWQALGSGLPGRVDAVAVYNGELIAGGWYTDTPSRIARYDEASHSWQQMGSLPSNVFTLKVYNGELYCTTGASIQATLWRWNGSAWTAISPSLDSSMLTLEVFQGKLYTGGRISRIYPNGATLRNMAAWDGSAWSPGASGADGSVLAYTEWNGDVYAAGSFTQLNGQALSHIARRTPAGWQPLGSGIDGTVRALSVHGGELVAAGSFTSAGGVSASNIAKWNGTAWSALGSGANGVINGLCLDADGTLVAGGQFTAAGGVAAARVARWNGSAWSPLGGGTDGTVNDVALYQGSIVATGQFDIAQPQWCRAIARFNGAQWEHLGPEPQGQAGLTSSGLTGTGKKLLVDGGDLWVIGNFARAGNVITTNAAVLRDGSWNVANFPGTPNALAIGLRGRVTASSDFAVYEFGPSNTWQQLFATGFDPVAVMRTVDGLLYIGGGMSSVGTMEAAGWATVTYGAPVVTELDAPVQVPAGAAMTLTATAKGVPPLTYQWRKDGVPIVDGGTVSGATTAQLTVNPAAAGDAGFYEVVVTSGCATSVTGSATVTAPCLSADLAGQGGAPGGDGHLDNNDFVVFIDYFFNHNPLADVGGQGGVAGADGQFDNNDFVVFIDAFFSGCL
jgi:hypothetical protein